MSTSRWLKSLARWSWTGANAMVSAVFWWLAYTRYLKYADCIDALSNSSCFDESGGNVIAGGQIWLLPAFGFSLAALISAVRARAGSRAPRSRQARDRD